MRYSPARTWWLVLGWTLIAIAILGLFDPVVQAFHGMTFHLEGGENVLHWILGAATLTVGYFLRDEVLLGTLSIWYGVVYLAVGVLGFFWSNPGVWHVGLADNLLHLALGAVTIAVGVANRNWVDRPHTA